MASMGFEERSGFLFAVVNLGAPITAPAGVLSWEVGDGPGAQGRGLSWGHGAGKEALTLLCDFSPIPFPLWASVSPWAKSGGWIIC